MIAKHNNSLVANARYLRKNMTKEEKHLWYDFLKSYPTKFLRQKILGMYIADFYCASANLVIELDGSEHYDPEAKIYDQKRTQFLEGYGIRVVRIPNTEVNKNFYGVCEHIDRIVKERLNNPSVTIGDSSLYTKEP
jgi:very-short-patch-repair endonuclease